MKELSDRICIHMISMRWLFHLTSTNITLSWSSKTKKNNWWNWIMTMYTNWFKVKVELQEQFPKENCQIRMQWLSKTLRNCSLKTENWIKWCKKLFSMLRPARITNKRFVHCSLDFMISLQNLTRSKLSISWDNMNKICPIGNQLRLLLQRLEFIRTSRLKSNFSMQVRIRSRKLSRTKLRSALDNLT